jgi:hypothetical protein
VLTGVGTRGAGLGQVNFGITETGITGVHSNFLQEKDGVP